MPRSTTPRTPAKPKRPARAGVPARPAAGGSRARAKPSDEPEATLGASAGARGTRTPDDRVRTLSGGHRRQ